VDILYIPPPLPFLPLSPPLLPLQPQIRRNNSAMDTEPMGKCSWVVWTEKESPDMGCVEGMWGCEEE